MAEDKIMEIWYSLSIKEQQELVERFKIKDLGVVQTSKEHRSFLLGGRKESQDEN